MECIYTFLSVHELEVLVGGWGFSDVIHDWLCRRRGAVGGGWAK